jgi:hypothetical protein
MSADACWLTNGADAEVAVARFLNDFTGQDRIAAIHLVLTQLRRRVEPDRVLACELAWEIHTGAYWSQLKDAEGRHYESEEAYFREVLGLASWRTAYKRLAIGRMLCRFEASERPLVRAAIAEVGLAKATLIVPAIERTGEWAAWAALARRFPAVTLQLRISEALHAQPRGRESLPPGERFRRSVLSAMPDIEAMEVVERFFEVGASVVVTDHPVGIFLAGCRECLADWEVHAEAQRKKRTNIPEHSAVAHVDNGEPPLSHPEFCPRGQNRRTSAH